MIIKRLFDVLLVVPGILFLLPVFIAVPIWIRTESDGPIFFRQERVGKAGKRFEVLKFRTMVVNAESLGGKVTVGGDPRITKCGSFLRKYKLDELPQLINVLKGDMSLVGPRPEVPEYVSYWPVNVKKKILSLPPGITDLASIEFRNENELLQDAKDPEKKYIEEVLPIKLNLYLKYADEQSVWLDIKILFMTLYVILSK